MKDHLPERLRGQTRIDFLTICYAMRAQVQILQWSNFFWLHSCGTFFPTPDTNWFVYAYH